jgi:vacuolar-type H+-ATPase subunit H
MASLDLHARSYAMQGDDLHRLTETEARLAAQMAEAEAEARRRVEEARAGAEQAERELAAELAAAEAALAREVEEEAGRQRAALAERARTEAARLDGLPEVEIAGLAEAVVARLLADWGRP